MSAWVVIPAIGYLIAAWMVGHGLGDRGLAVAVFVALAAGSASVALIGTLAGTPAAGSTLFFGALPALVGAGIAYAGGRSAEQ